MKRPLQAPKSNQQQSRTREDSFARKAFLLLIGAILIFPEILDAQEPTANVFLPAPRVVKQHLSRARKAIEEEQFSDAVSHLGTILTEEFDEDTLPGAEPAVAPANANDNQDYFVELEDSPGTFVSLKGEAQRLLGTLPNNALEIYELQYGTEATQILNSALASGELSQLTEVTRKYFHTQAGYESAILLAYRDLDSGRPLAAALNFQRVHNTPGARKKYDPELSLVLATCWLHAQLPNKASETLLELKSGLPEASFEIGGERQQIFTTDENPIDWLNALAGKGQVISINDNIEWVLFRGSPDRNAISQGGVPLPSIRWRVPTGADRLDEGHLQSLIQSQQLQKQHAISSVQPLVIGKTVITRSPSRVIAIDFESGKRLWEFPWFDSEDEESLLETSTQNAGSADISRKNELQQRLMQDHAFGQVCSDGKQVFALWDLEIVKKTNSRSFVFNPRASNAGGPSSTNKLVSLDLETEGSLNWIVGGETGEDDPDLAGIFFLGPPLPLYNDLYAIGEKNGEIRLLVLDAETGSLKWQQQLAHVDNRKITLDSNRRLASASPSFADGVLVCPTSAGAIVAVDISSRTLLWGYTYANRNLGQTRQLNGIRYNSNELKKQQWIDSTITISDGSVVATPPENSNLICLNLLTGKPHWRPVTRTGDLYIGCVVDNIALIIGKTKISSISLETGESVWQNEVLIEQGVVNGRGFRSDDTYFIPISNKQLLQLDIKTGEKLKTIEVNEPLGNLVCFNDQVISQTPDAISVYYQLEPLREEVTQRLAANDKDIWALSRQSELHLQEGNYDAALTTLRKSMQLAPDNLPIEQLLIRTMLRLLQQDYATYKTLLAELEILPLTSQQIDELLQTKAAGQLVTGEIIAAFDTYLQLIDHARQSEDAGANVNEVLKLTEQGVHVRTDRWVQGQMRALLAASNDQQRTEIESRISQYLEEAVTQKDTLRLRDFTRFFGTHTLADTARIELASALVNSDSSYIQETIESELLLVTLQLNSADEQIQRRCHVELAKLYEKVGRHQDAYTTYVTIKQRWPAKIVEGELTGQQYVEQRLNTPHFEQLVSSRNGWPLGFTSVEKTTDKEGRFPSYQRIYNIPIKEVRGPWPAGNTVGYDQQKNAIAIRSASGKIVQQVSLNTGRQVFGTQYTVAYAKIYGHYMFTFIGREVLAIDLLNASNDPSEAILWRKPILPANASGSVSIPLRSRVTTTPWGTRRYNAVDAAGNKLGISGAISLNGIVYQQQGDLYCIDPITGNIIWIRNGVKSGSEIYTEGNRIIVIPPNSVVATEYSLTDGAEVQQVEGINRSERWPIEGFKSLIYQLTGTDIMIGLQDVSNGEMVWQQTYATGLRGQMMGTHLALMQPTGKFEIRDLLTGQPVIEKTLPEEPQMTNLYVIEYDDQYLVIPNRSATLRGITIPSIGMQTRLINGSIYALDATSGEFLWQTPASVEGWALPLAQSTDSPVMAFIRQLNPTSTQNRTSGSIRSEVFCMDKRDGRMLMPPRELPGYIRVFNVISDLENQKVTVVADKNHIFEFSITGEPTWPAAPLQMHSQVSGANKGAANAFAKGFFEAFRQVDKAVEQRNQQKQIQPVPAKQAPKVIPVKPAQEKVPPKNPPPGIKPPK
ncbi:MAG: hypothetical protein CMJ76_13005 [Planctomycetaceae bacterium]|nr:hypothetical protein [Planctomycetaceae bacterium]